MPWQMKNIFIIVLFLLDLSGNAQFCKVFLGEIVAYSEITDCDKSEQNLASYYYLLVVKLVVKRIGLLLTKGVELLDSFCYYNIPLILANSFPSKVLPEFSTCKFPSRHFQPLLTNLILQKMASRKEVYMSLISHL